MMKQSYDRAFDQDDDGHVYDIHDDYCSDCEHYPCTCHACAACGAVGQELFPMEDGAEMVCIDCVRDWHYFCPVKRCACCGIMHTMSGWERLEPASGGLYGHIELELDGWLVEYRNCTCGSTILLHTGTLVEPIALVLS